MVAQTRNRRGGKPAQVEVRVLDSFAVLADGRAAVDASWSRKKPQALVKLLALHGRPVTRDVVLTTLWPDLDSAAAAANLRKCRFHLRTKLREAGVDDILELDGDAYRLRDGVTADVGSVRARAAEALASRDPALIEEATGLLAGDLLAHGEAWAEPFRAELTRLRSDLLLDLASLHEDAGDTDAAIDILDALLAEEPTHEPAHRALMRVYASTERPATALRQYERCKAALRRDLGVAPAAETVELRELVFGSIYRSAESASRTRPGPFVGRAEEMRALNQALSAALEGQGQAIFITGDPGVGKSRLTEEFATLAILLGARVVRGQSFADSQPFEPWIQILRQVAGRTRAGSAGRMTLNSYVSGPSDQVPADSDESQRHARAGLIERVRAFIDAAAREQPLTIVLEDIHAADPDSLGLLRYLATDVRDAPLLVLCTRRSTVERDALRELRALATEPHVSSIELQPLDERAARELLRSGVGRRMSPATTAALLSRARGNPLFLTEFSRIVGSEKGGGSPGGSLPRRVRDAIREHARELPAECLDLLKPASALGARFLLPVLEDIVDIEAGELVERLRPALAGDVLRDVGGAAPEFEFVHPLIGETLYEELSNEERVTIHQRIAETLERRQQQGLDASAADLAHHFLRALPRVELSRALEWARRAGDEATEALAFEDARHWYGQALDTMDKHGGVADEDRYEHLMRFALAARRVGDNERSRERLRQAVRIALAIGDGRRVARPLREYLATHLPAFQVDAQLVELVEEGLKLTGSQDSVARAELLTVLGRSLVWSPDRGRAAVASREAIEVGRRIDDHEALGYALFSWHYAQRRPDNVVERLQVSTEYLEIAEEQADRDGLALAHRLHLIDLLQLGDVDGVDVDLDAIADLTDAATPPYVKRHLYGMSSMRALLAGDFEAAEQFAIDAHRERRKAQIPDATGLLGYQLLAIRGEQGRLSEMEQLVKSLVEEYGGFSGARVLLARLYADVGKHAEAREEFDMLTANDFHDVPYDQTRLPILAGLALVCAEIANEERAQMLYELLLPHADHTAVTSDALVCSGSLSRHLGLLATTLGRLDDAGRHFDAALAMNERMRSRPLVAHTQVDYARLLVDRSAEPDRTRPNVLLNRAARTARDLGMAGLLRQIERSR